MRQSNPPPTNSGHRVVLDRMLASIPGTADALSSVVSGVDDWGAFWRFARHHGVAGEVAAEMHRVGMPLPGDAARENALEETKHHLLHGSLRAALQRVVRELASAGLRAVVLKGPLLAERLYAAPFARPSSDIDLLVRPGDVDSVAVALAPLRYQIEGGASGRYFRRHHHHVHLFHENQATVELHYHAYRGFGATMDSPPLLERAVEVDLPGWEGAWVLAPEDEFLYLAVHGASHRFERAGWLYDLKLLLAKHPGLDWSAVRARADALGLGAVLSLTCELLGRTMGVATTWSEHVEALGSTRSKMVTRLLDVRERRIEDALARMAYTTLLCQTPASAARDLTRFLALKVVDEIPRRVRARAHWPR